MIDEPPGTDVAPDVTWGLGARLRTPTVAGYDFDARVVVFTTADANVMLVMQFRSGRLVSLSSRSGSTSGVAGDDVVVSLDRTELVGLLSGRPVLDGLVAEGRYSSESTASLAFFNGAVGSSTLTPSEAGRLVDELLAGPDAEDG